MLGSKKYLETRQLVDLTAPLDGWHDPTFGIGHDGAIYAVARRSKESRREEAHPSQVSFAKTHFARPTDYRVVRWHDGAVDATTIPGETLVVSFVQPLGDGVLLAGARCRWRESGADRNAIVVGRGGEIRARLTLGDGLHFVRTTPDDRIWAGYFDEGVFGNYGWGGPGPAPIGAPGLVAFSPTGEITRTFDGETAGTDDICDVYALNARGADDVWVYFYTDFAIVHVGAQQTRAWKTRVEGARALAVRDHEVALVGGYDNRAMLRVVALGKHGFAKTIRKLTLPDELANAEVHGVGDRLYFVVDRRVVVADAW